MVAFPFRMPMGFAGQVTRSEEASVEAAAYNPANMPPAYGVFVGEDVSGIRPLTAADVAPSGILIRPYPTSGTGTDGLGVAAPVANTGNASLLKRGYMLMKLGGTAAAVRRGQVFLRVGNPSAGKVIGGVEAAADLTAAVAPKAGNTGNATIVMDAVAPINPSTYKPGVYTVVYLTATTFNVFDPQGDLLGNGANGAAFNNEIKFVATAGGTPMVANDTLNVTVSPNTMPMSGSLSGAGTYFTGPADAGGIVEVAYNI